MTARRPNRPRIAATLALLGAAACHGCASMNHAERGALLGTGFGALAGAMIGHAAGNTGLGTVIGAGTGMIAGSVIGDAEDAREERDAALDRAYAAEAYAASPPLTNADLMYMAQNGLGDQVILNAVRTRGGQFQVDPAALVQLKQGGVSDAVLAEIQKSGGVRPVSYTETRVIREPRRVVYVEPVYAPPPPVGVSFSVGSSCAPRYHHHYRSCHYW